MKLLRLLPGYALYHHNTTDSIRYELQTDCILDKVDEYKRNWLLHLQSMPQNRNFLILPLKPTRNENKWETEETTERATVTLEKERAKWAKPGCL
jgi:hypothetical protein